MRYGTLKSVKNQGIFFTKIQIYIYQYMYYQQFPLPRFRLVMQINFDHCHIAAQYFV